MKNTVILKSYKDGIAIYLDDTLEFEQLCLDLAQKFRDSARFFGDMQVAVSFEGRTSSPCVISIGSVVIVSTMQKTKINTR